MTAELNETEKMILRLLSDSPNLIAIAVVKRLLDQNPPQLVQPTLWNLETRGFVDSGIRPDSHQRVYWVTELGKEILRATDDSNSISSIN